MIYYTVHGEAYINRKFNSKEKAEKFYNSIVGICTHANLTEHKDPTKDEWGYSNDLHKKEYDNIIK